MASTQAMGRRGFLGLALAGGGTLAATAGSRAAADPGGVDWTALRAAVAGPLIRPGDRLYTAAATPYNAALGVRRPAAIARVASRADIGICVKRVRDHGIPIAARSGEHSYAGFSTPDNGIAGGTLGGAIGVLARAYGLSCDHLTGATVISADGDRDTVNANSNRDLFWNTP